MYTCAMTHSYTCYVYMCHDSFLYMLCIRVPWLIPINVMYTCVVTWLIPLRAMTRSSVRHDSFIRVTWLICLCVMTQSHASHELLLYVPRLNAWHISIWIHIYETTQQNVFLHAITGLLTWDMCVTWLVNMCDMTHFHTCDMTRLHVWHDSFRCVTWLARIRDMTQSYVWHVSFTRVTWIISHQRHE